MFHVGQKVVCVDATGLSNGVSPVEGNVYTIEKCCWWDKSVLGFEGLGVWLQEIDRPTGSKSGLVQPYAARRFRPAVSRPTNIQIFKDLLRDPDKTIREDA